MPVHVCVATLEQRSGQLVWEQVDNHFHLSSTIFTAIDAARQHVLAYMDQQRNNLFYLCDQLLMLNEFSRSIRICVLKLLQLRRFNRYKCSMSFFEQINQKQDTVTKYDVMKTQRHYGFDCC